MRNNTNSVIRYLYYLVYISLVGVSSMVQCGQINGWDIIVDYSNRDLISKYTLVFTLATPLDATDFIQVQMPYAIHSTLTGTSPTEMKATLGSINYSTCSSTDTITTITPDQYINSNNQNTVTIYTASTSSTLYQFSLNSALSSGVEYALIISTTVFPTAQPLGIQNYIGIATISGTGLGASTIVYDKNDLFSPFALSANSLTTLQVGYEVTASNQNDFSATYQVYVDILNSVSASSGSLYEIQFGSGSSSPFSFLSQNVGTITNLCQSVSKNTNSYVVAALPTSQYSCVVSNNKISIQVYSTLLANTRLRFAFYVVNPIYARLTKEYLKVNRLSINSRNIMESGFCSSFLYVQGINLQTSGMKIGWGVDETVTPAPNQVLPLFTNAASGVGTYNSIQFQFSLQKSTPTGLQLQLLFNVGTGSNGQASILQGSIIHNFPEITGTARGECGIISDGLTRVIQCINVGSMTAKTVYFIGFKIMFMNGATVAPAFSQLTINLLNPDNNYQPYTDPIVSNVQIKKTSSITLVSNTNYYLNGSGSTAVSSQVIANQASAVYNPFSDATNGILGIVPEKVANTAQKLIFCINLNPSSITTINDAGPATSQRAGYYMVTNSNVIQFQQSGLAIDQYGNLQASQIISANTVFQADQYQNLDLGQYSRLRMQTSLMRDISNMFSGGMIYAIRTVFVRQHASLYADENSLDFYFFFYDNIQNYQPSYQFPILYNAYTINTPKPKNLRYSLVNWYGGYVNNNGANVPTFIRLAGYLSSTDFTDGNQRLFVFFSGVNFYQDSSSTINYSTQCTSSVGATPTVCRGFLNQNSQNIPVDQNFIQMQRVEVQFPTTVPTGSGSPFELLIPVSTITGVTQITLFIATMKYNYLIPSTALQQAAIKNYFFQPSTVFRLTGSNNLQDTTQFISFSSSAANNIPLSNNYMMTGILRIDSYGMNLQNNYVGQLAPQISVSARHTETTTVIGTNTGSSATPQNGAGFTFVTSYDFRGTQQNFFWQGGLPSNIRKCLSYKYNQDGNQNWRYGFFCSMEVGTTATVSQVNITNFQLPSTLGLYLPSSTSFAYSTSMGQLASLLYQSQTIGYPNQISVTLNSASPTINLFAKDIRLIWSFTTTNPLPQQGYVQIVFKDPIVLTGIATSLCQFQTTIPHTCTVTQPAGQNKVLLFQFNSLSSTQLTLPGGFMQIYQYGIDAPTSSTSNNLFLVQTLTSSSVLIDQTQSSLGYPSYLNYNNLDTQKSLLLINGGYLNIDYPYYGAESTISVSFNTNDRRGLLQKEIIILNFKDNLAAANVQTINTQIDCSIWTNGAVNHNFLSAQIINTSTTIFQVVFQVKNDISYSDYFTAKCRNVRLPASGFTIAPTIELFKSDGTTPIQLAATTTIPVISAAAVTPTTATLAKQNFNTYGSICTLTITFTITSMATGTNFFLIRFPIAYLPSLVQDASLMCQINTITSPCYISNPQTLIVSNVPTNTLTYSINIIGVQLPLIAGTLNTFYVALVSQITSSSSLIPVSYAFINDIVTNPQSNSNFFINGINLANTNVQSTNTLTFNFTLATGFLVLNTDYNFYITFPSQWQYLLQLFTPQITLRRISTNTYLTIKSTSTITYVYFQFNWGYSTNTASELFTLSLSNIVNPQNPICILPKQWVFHVQQGSGTQSLTARSVSMMNQIPYFKFNYHSTTSVLTWSYPDSNNVFTVNQGPFQTLVTLKLVNNSRFQYPVRIALKDDTLFGIIPQRPFAQPGASQIQFYIYAKSQTPTSNYVVYFLKTDDNFNNYSTVPICNITLVQQKQQLVYSNSTTPFYIPKNGLSNPLIITLANQGFVVTQAVSVTVTVLQGSTYNIQVQNSAGTLGQFATKTIPASSSNPSVIFRFSAGSNSIVGTQVYIQITVNVANPSSSTSNLNNLFGLPSNLQLEVNQISYSGVQFKIYSSTQDVIYNTTALYRPYCPQQGTIYYKVQLVTVYSMSNSSNTTVSQANYDALKTEIISNAESFYNYVSNTQQQIQYGFVASNPSGQYTEILIQNLMSSKQYQIQSFCQNNFNQQSINVLDYIITMGSNSGSITKIPLTLNSAISLPDKIKLTCFISIFLHIPPSSVYTDDFVTCNSYSSEYDYGNSLGNINYVKQNTRSSFTIYFIPDWTSNIDYVLPIVSAAVQSPTFVFSLKKFVTDYSNYYFLEWDLGLPSNFLTTPFTGISTVGSLQNVTITTNPIINENYYVDINQVSSVLNVTEVMLTNNGFIFVGLESQLTDLTKQNAYNSFTSYQLIQGQNYLGSSMTYGVQVQLGNKTADSTFIFQNLLPTSYGSKYELFMAVSQEDPSPYAMKSTLRKTKIINYSVTVVSSTILAYTIILLIWLMIVL